MLLAAGAIHRYGIGSQITRDPSVWGFGAVPVGRTGIRGAEINARMLGMFSGIRGPKVRSAAWDCTNFIGSEDAQQIRTDTFIEMGMVNQLNPADLRKFGYTSFLDLAEPGLEEEFDKAIATAKPEPYGKNRNLVYVERTYPLDQILLSPIVAAAWKRGNRDGIRVEIQRILNQAVERTNERMLGIVPPEVMQTRRIVAWGVVALIFVTFVCVGRMILKTFSEIGQATNRVRGIQFYCAWGLLLIPLLLTLVWNYIPLARGAGMALMNFHE